MTTCDRLTKYALGAVLALGLLGACSVNTYKPGVERLATATEQTRDAYEQAERTVLTARTEALRQEILLGKRQVGPLPETCGIGRPRCILGAAKPREQPEPLYSSFDNLNAILRNVADYTMSLRAIVNSDAAQQVNANLVGAGGSIKNLAKTAGVSADSVATIEPAAALIGWVAGEYINLMQVAALREATRMANPTIKATEPIFTEALTAATNTVVADLFEKYRQAAQAHDRAPSNSGLLAQYETAAKNLDQASQASDNVAFASLVKAHDDLTAALSGRNVTLADAIASINQFAAKAETLQRLVTTVADTTKAKK